ncbi:MAG TPA: hypothetical protein VF781_04910 [Solirubrobacteraceae bacterium]
MAKTKREQDLAQKLRASGLRKRAADLIAGATDGRRKPRKNVHRIVDDLKQLLSDAEDQVRGGPAKRKAAAQKAAKTRKQNAARRSAAAKKGARTRAKTRS